VASSLPANAGRDIWGATFNNDANNLIITLNLGATANINTSAYNYGIGITTGAGAGGDTSANATTHGNPYQRALSIDSSLGGMTDWIGLYGAGGSGTAGSPYTSYGFNDYVFGTPGSTGVTLGAWTKKDTVASGQPNTVNSITITVPMSDFAANLSLTPGTTFYFDIYSTGTTSGQTAYDSLANSSPTQTGTYNGLAQYNGTVLYSYTVTAVPEPTVLALAGLGGLSLMLFRRQRK
jgi:hypothetical protein